jgi:hypothetical protein
MTSLNRHIAELLGIIDLLEDAVKFDAYVKAEEARRKANQARRAARFANMLAHSTTIQLLRTDALEQSGYTITKAWQKKSTGRIAVMCQKTGVWDDIKMKMGTKLVMVYPDGRRQEAFGKIPLHEEWI